MTNRLSYGMASGVAKRDCYEYILELAYSAVNHSLMIPIAIKKNTIRQTNKGEFRLSLY
jgi:hypothetical protein